ncbi:MAG: hypothetical protein KAT62_12480 [Desulfuromonadales bacterium]|nr:hypothetical protein [Desulfuromonadales bacterium]
MKDTILSSISEFYISSRGFNGIPISTLAKKVETAQDALPHVLSELLDEDKIEIIYGNYHPNPHIKAFSGFAKEEQKANLENEELLNQACVYPSQEHLKQVVPDSLYDDRPYSRELALGAGQLDFRPFDLSVLEFYRNDPRYHYENNDISGWISVHDEYFESEKMPTSDQTLLQTFGFCYTENLDRAVAVFLRYLCDLSPEHQQIWKAKELAGDYKLHPDYYRNSILGDWGTKISIFDAFIEELSVINEMCGLMQKPPLFKNTFKSARPREFGFLLRPTLSEFNSFVHLLDKLMSDNLNKKFFEDEIELEDEEERNDGKIIIKPKGTIRLLQEWVEIYFRPTDPEPLNELFSAFKKVRKLRQKPAHAIKENEFDQKYFKDQRQLVKEACRAVRTIRLILANHPKVKENPPEINRHLFKGEIWDI